MGGRLSPGDRLLAGQRCRGWPHGGLPSLLYGHAAQLTPQFGRWYTLREFVKKESKSSIAPQGGRESTVGPGGVAMPANSGYYTGDKAEYVRQMFAGIADRY